MEKKELLAHLKDGEERDCSSGTVFRNEFRPGRSDARVRDKMTHDVNIEDDIVERERV